MKNYYVLKKITKKELPNKNMFFDFDKIKGTCQMQDIDVYGNIYICTDGSEIEDQELRVDLS